MSDLKDFITECMDDTGVEDATFEQFMQAFCSRCLNPECQRSAMHGLQWNHRMRRQEQALRNPDIADPNDPSVQHIAQQEWPSFERQKVRISDWESYSEPDKFKGSKEDPIIHKAEPETKSQTNRKIKDSASRLAGLNGKEVPEEEPEGEELEKEAPEEEEQKADPQRSEKEVASVPSNQYNTRESDQQLLLKPSQELLKPSPQALGESPSQRDAWTAPSKGKEKLVVRASDGKRVKKGFDSDEEKGYNSDGSDTESDTN